MMELLWILATLVLLCLVSYRMGVSKGRMETGHYTPESPEMRAATSIWEVTRQQGQLMLGLHDIPSRMDRLEKLLSSTQSSMVDVRQSTNSMLAAFVRAGLIKAVSRDEMVGEDSPVASGWGVDVPQPPQKPTPVKRAAARESEPLT